MDAFFYDNSPRGRFKKLLLIACLLLVGAIISLLIVKKGFDDELRAGHINTAQFYRKHFHF